MLNELYLVSESLKSAGIKPQEISPLFKKNSKQKGIRLYLNASAEIVDINVMQAEQIGELRRYERSNGFSFPTMNLGLLKKVEKEVLEPFAKTKSFDENSALFCALVEASSTNFSERDFRDLTKKLQDIPQQVAPFWTDLSEQEQKRYGAIEKLIYALIEKKWEAKDFLLHLEDKLLGVIKAGGSYAEELLSLSIDLYFRKKCPILWEWKMLDQEAHAITSTKMRDFLNERLLRKQEEGNSDGIDAFTNNPAKIAQRFPILDLPVLGKTPIFSSPKEVRCQERYERTEGDIFPVSEHKTKELQNALYFITNKKRGTTWDLIPADVGKSNNLVIAYIDETADALEDDEAILLAEIFGDEPSSTEEQEALFEKHTEYLIKQLKKFTRDKSQTKINLFVISKPDPGRAHILYHSHFLVSDFNEAVKDWQDGCKNTPRDEGSRSLITLFLGKGDKKEPRASYPLQALRTCS